MTPQPGDSLLEAFERWQGAADKKACCDYSLHVDIPLWDEAVKDELEVLVQDKGMFVFGCNSSEHLLQALIVGHICEECREGI